MKRTAVILAIAALACHKVEKPVATTTTMKEAQPAPEPAKKQLIKGVLRGLFGH